MSAHMQGRCSEPPPPSFMNQVLEQDRRVRDRGREPWEAPRCVLVAADDLFVVEHPAVWLHALHIQFVSSLSDYEDRLAYPVGYHDNFVFHLSNWAFLFVTDTVVELDAQLVGMEAVVRVQYCGGGLLMKGALWECAPCKPQAPGPQCWNSLGSSLGAGAGFSPATDLCLSVTPAWCPQA